MKLKKSERGFTLLEVLVSLAISAFVVGAASATTITMMRLTPQNNDWAVALHQVQNAGYWISRDVLMAQDITVGAGNPTFLTLTIPQITPPDKTIVYEFEDMPDGLKRLIRDDQTAGQTILVAEYISTDTNDTTASYNSDNRTLDLTITAISGDVSVTRIYESSQRLGGP